MTIMEIPTKPLSGYATWLKVEGLVYMGLPLAAYFVKTGLAWHDARLRRCLGASDAAR